ncbi:MAG: Rho termination factor N-terminal domain-containing protein [Gammaproteobacteria bacterium]|nr:Rho termination factor N-terminal domain-containing protein [Gammaproteobacteria bacterium]
MNQKTVSELRSLAKKLGIPGYSRMRKDELIRAINTAQKSKSTKKLKTKATPRKSVKKPAVKASTTPKVEAGRKKPERESAASDRSATLSDQEQQIETAKYATSIPGSPLPPSHFAEDLAEDIESLPPIHRPRLSLLPQKPGVFHAYWVLTPGHLINQSSLRLRLSSLVQSQLHILEEISLPSDRGHWYFHADPAADTGKIYLQLGHYNDKHEFVIAIERGIVHAPRLGVSSTIDPRWWISEAEFRRLYVAAGGQLRNDQLLWPTYNLGSPGNRQHISSW